jgi:2-phospho-L-lactate guanylyltransferase
MRVLVPYTERNPKSRLAPVLSESERRAFSRASLCDVVDAVRGAGGEPELLLSKPLDETRPVGDGGTRRHEALEAVATTVDERSLTSAVNRALDRIVGREATEVAVVMADLALATPTALRRLFAVSGDVAIAPGLGGGTNALVVRDPAFRVDYHGASVRDHRRIATEAGLSVDTVDSMRLAVDVDEPTDLVEVLVHGRGAAREWLLEAGFEIDDGDGGRVGVRRE